MKKSLRSQDKSIYLAFALIPSIAFESFYDREQSSDRRFYFQLTKGNQRIDNTNSFGIESMQQQHEMYLYLSLPKYAQKLNDTYSIKLIDQTLQQPEILYDEEINLNHYIDEHKTQQKDLWTQILKTTTNNSQKIIIMQRVFLKTTRFQLQDIINSFEIGEQLDIVDIPVGTLKTSKLSIDKRKSWSYQTPLNSLISPRRLDTISEEDSTLPMADRKQRQSIGDNNKPRVQRMSTFIKKEVDFENELQRKSTWVEKNNNFDDEFITAFQQRNHDEGHKNMFREEKSLNPDFDRLKVKSLTENEIPQNGSKISKNTKDSEKYIQENSISFLQKSSLLMDMSQSELSISPDEEVCFKLKWIILAVVILLLAVVASMQTDAFDITNNGKHKAKRYKKKVVKTKSKETKAHKSKERIEVHV